MSEAKYILLFWAPFHFSIDTHSGSGLDCTPFYDNMYLYITNFWASYISYFSLGVNRFLRSISLLILIAVAQRSVRRDSKPVGPVTTYKGSRAGNFATSHPNLATPHHHVIIPSCFLYSDSIIQRSQKTLTLKSKPYILKKTLFFLNWRKMKKQQRKEAENDSESDSDGENYTVAKIQ